MSGHGKFGKVATGVIATNAAIAVAGWAHHDWEEPLARVEDACLLFFSVEMALKIYWERRGFWRSRWNVFDLAVTVLAALPMVLVGVDMGILRVARVARLFHLGRHLSTLRLLRYAVFAAVKAHWRYRVRGLPLVIREA
jgi:voltage-gated sodium channel